jgi:hypothetical protein
MSRHQPGGRRKKGHRAKKVRVDGKVVKRNASRRGR